MSGSFGDEVFPDLSQALELLSVNAAIVVGVAPGVLQPEDGEQLIGRSNINLLERSLVISD